jgi:uncharacterized small protein (DUF1192 family)
MVNERTCKCTATRADGRPCGARAVPGETLCWAHSPRLAQKRRQAQSAGGYAKGNAARAQKLVPTMLRPILALLVSGMKQVYEGQLEPQRYTAMAAGASALCRIFSLAELEERIATLEQDLRHVDAG